MAELVVFGTVFLLEDFEDQGASAASLELDSSAHLEQIEENHPNGNGSEASYCSCEGVPLTDIIWGLSSDCVTNVEEEIRGHDDQKDRRMSLQDWLVAQEELAGKSKNRDDVIHE